ncbi:hypothetical protein V2G26_015673 [Clonostachys chloroleuca]
MPPSTLTLSPGATAQRPLYFAYGSNLSYSQMQDRCKDCPGQSAVPVAIARLDGWKWIIGDRGYATIIPPPLFRGGSLLSEWGATDVEESTSREMVYGILYNITSDDEALLDGYESVDHDAPASKGHVSLSMRPREQGEGHYTKWYVSVHVEEWLADRNDLGTRGENITSDSINEKGLSAPTPKMCTALVYVDEECVRESEPKSEYIIRMNRGITEACSIGLPEQWVNTTMRRFIPKS